MGNIQVTALPQAVYPDGLQDSFVIQNHGPYTVYVDSDSSINTDSHALPPTGSLAWDAQRPLWVLGSPLGNSSISIARNSQAAIFGNAIYRQLYSNTNVDVHAGANPDTGILECSAYNGLIVTLKSTDFVIANGGATANYWLIVLTWYDDDGNILSVQDFTPFPQVAYPIAERSGLRLSVPVIGARVKIAYQANGAGSYHANINVVGTTRALDPMFSFAGGETYPAQVNSAGGIAAGIDSFVYYDISAAGYGDIYLPGVKNHLRLVWRSSQVIATAGSVALLSNLNASNYGASPLTTLGPAGTNDGQVDWVVPTSLPMRLNFVPPKNGGATNCTPFSVSLFWYD